MLLAAGGCGHRTPYELSSQDKQRFVDVVRVDRGTAKAPLTFGISDCTVYRAETDNQQITGWRIVLRSDWGQTSYPKFLTGCVNESMQLRRGYVLVDMCARAIGAGGGCNGGGRYRSRDGEKWKIFDDASRWVPLPK